jgi:DNA modification methylase
MQDLIVTRIDKARQLLAQAKDAPEAKKVVDLAHAAEVYARRQKLSQDSIDYAHAVKIDAMRLLGEMLKETPKNKGGQPMQKRSTCPKKEQVAPTLPEVGINRKESSQAQKLARIAADGDGLFDEVRSGKKTIAQAEREIHRQAKREELDRKAKDAPEGSGSWHLFHGECTDILPTIEAGTARLVFADPPYNIGIDYGQGAKADRLPDADYLRWCRTWLDQCINCLTPDGSLWVLIGDEYAAEYGVLLKQLGLTVRAWVKWYETFGVNQANNFNRCSRHLFYCVRDAKRFVFNASAVNRPSDRQTKYADARADPAGKIWDDVWMIPRLVGTAKERIPDFPTQLPLELLWPIIGCASDPGDVVIDPFAGSATTGAACLELGRKFIGIEKSATYHGLATKRLKAAAG